MLEGLSYPVELSVAVTLPSLAFLALCLATRAPQREVDSLGHLLHLLAPLNDGPEREREIRAGDLRTNCTPRGRSAQNWARGAYESFEGEEDVDLDAVELLTVHKAKGSE